MKLNSLTTKNLSVLLVATTLFANNDSVFLVDTSGSMSKKVIRTKVAKVVDTYLKNDVAVIGFNSVAYDVFNVKDLKFKGNTLLGKALKKSIHHSISYIVIMTDGNPSDKEETLNNAKVLKEQGVKICSIYISENKNKAPKILTDISDAIFVTNDIGKIKKLCGNETRNRLLGKEAVYKVFDETKYNLF